MLACHAIDVTISLSVSVLNHIDDKAALHSIDNLIEIYERLYGGTEET